MLTQLSLLSGISLGIHSCADSELSNNYPEIDGWDDFVQLPPLGRLAALTELCLAGRAALPPDFRQLSSLQRLMVVDVYG